jgi:K+-sensing histidine kinase KdpD
LIDIQTFMAAAAPPGNQSDINVSWDNIVRFVRQLSHDLRNDLNAAGLQAAFVSELTGEDAELKEEVKRLRALISKLAVTLEGISSAVGQISPNMMPYRVSDFVEDVRQKILKDFPAESAAVNWENQTSDAMVSIDPQLLQLALLEIFRNAFQHERGEGPLAADARINNEKFVFTLSEPKARFELSTENWGREPIGKVGQGHYGLGLNRVRVILKAHGGELRAQYDPKASELVTTITLPISGADR